MGAGLGPAPGNEALGAAIEPHAYLGFGLDPILHLVPRREASRLGLVIGRLLDEPVDLFRGHLCATVTRTEPPDAGAGLDHVARRGVRGPLRGPAACSRDCPRGCRFGSLAGCGFRFFGLCHLAFLLLADASYEYPEASKVARHVLSGKVRLK